MAGRTQNSLTRPYFHCGPSIFGIWKEKKKKLIEKYELTCLQNKQKH